MRRTDAGEGQHFIDMVCESTGIRASAIRVNPAEMITNGYLITVAFTNYP